MSLKPIIIGNWKMHTTLSEAMVLTERLRQGCEDIHDVEIVIAPPSIWLYPIADHFAKFSPDYLKLACQNVSWHDQGAYTGEISAKMVKGLVDYVLVGHSEQVRHFGLTDHQIKATVNSVLSNGLVPVVIVGEHKKSSHSSSHIVNRLKRILSGINKSDYEKLIIAYEPIWAVGTGKSATGAYAGSVCQSIKDVVGESVRVIYGGSTHPGNVSEFIRQSSIDGILPGSSSLKASDFLAMAKELIN